MNKYILFTVVASVAASAWAVKELSVTINQQVIDANEDTQIKISTAEYNAFTSLFPNKLVGSKTLLQALLGRDVKIGESYYEMKPPQRLICVDKTEARLPENGALVQLLVAIAEQEYHRNLHD